MRPPLPPELNAEREALIAEIRTAFADVTREGGISWSGAAVLDAWGSEEECAAASAQDKDQHWSELIDDEAWQPTIGGHFCFLDAIGFRYYLPAAMIRDLVKGLDMHLDFHLTFNDYALDTWTLLDSVQQRCIAKFMRFMMRMHDDDRVHWDDDWREAYESYWCGVVGDRA